MTFVVMFVGMVVTFDSAKDVDAFARLLGLAFVWASTYLASLLIVRFDHMLSVVPASVASAASQP